MSVNAYLFSEQIVTVLTVSDGQRFLARLVAGDVSCLDSGSAMRTVMLNATGGVIDTVYVARQDQNTFKLFLIGENADVREAWVRQVALAFDADIQTTRLQGCFWSGEIPSADFALCPYQYKTVMGVELLDLRWIRLMCAAQDVMHEITSKLLALGVRRKDDVAMDALRIMAREPAFGYEFDENTSPLECGLEDAVDFKDGSRIFIGRALTEARANAGVKERLYVVAIDSALGAEDLTDVPLVVVGEMGYPFTSLSTLTSNNLTVGLVRLPSQIEAGAQLSWMIGENLQQTKCRIANAQV